MVAEATMPAMQTARIDSALMSRRLRAARAIIELFHFPPILVVLLAAGQFVIIAADDAPPYGRITLYLLAVLASQMAIGVHNDYCDRVLDAKAKPNRAIPSGVISAQTALQLTTALLAISVLLALPLGFTVVGLGVLGTAMGFVYNAFAKGTVLAWVPFWVALPTIGVASFVVCGAYRAELLVIYLIGLPLVVPVYIADTLIDVESDRAANIRSLATLLSPLRSRLLCWGSLLSGYVIAGAFWPDGGSPGVLSAISLGLCLIAVVSDRLGISRIHWLGIMLADVALACDWLLGFTG